MDKIDFNFFCQLLKENLCYAEISETLKKKKTTGTLEDFPCLPSRTFAKKMVYLQEFLKTMSMKWLE